MPRSAAWVAAASIAAGWVAAACVAACALAPRGGWFGPEPSGHSHNDYLHGKPLQTALAADFCSVEADVFPVGDSLLVGHFEWMLQPGRTLDALYLDPLMRRVEARGGSVHGDGRPFLLLVDIKQQPERALELLLPLLARHEPHLTRFPDGRIEPGAVTVLLSGARPTAAARAMRDRLFALDGRLADLERDEPASLMPLISAPWSAFSDWDAVDPMEEALRQRLAALVARCSARGQMLRFWAAPDRPEGWAELRAAGVRWLHTDRPQAFAAWSALR